MSDHLPECWYYDPAKTPAVAVNDGWPCICNRLCACEQRVLGDRDEIVGITAVRSFRAGLDAAEEAVAALEPLLDRSKHEGGYDCCGCATVGYLWTDALAVIDALKEKP